MKRLVRILPIVALTAVVSCAPVKVVTDMNRDVDFSRYETYSFMGWQEGSEALLNDFDKKRIQDAFIAEFDSRGLKYIEEGGDMEVSLYMVLDQKTSVTSYTDYHGSHGYGFRRYGGWGTGHATTSYNEYDYTQGTMVLDVFDSGSKELVWQAIASGTVEEKPSRRDKTIPRSINLLMSKFPVEPMA